MDNKAIRFIGSMCGAVIVYVVIKQNGNPFTFLIGLLLMLNPLLGNKEGENV